VSRLPCPGVAGQKVRDDASADRPDATQRLHLSPAPQQPIRRLRMEAGSPTGFVEEQAARNPFLAVEVPPALTGRCRRMGRVPKTHPSRLPDRKIILTRRKGGLPFRADKEMHCVPPPGREPRPHRNPSRKRNEGQRPARRGQSARHRQAGRFGPRRACGRRSAWPGRWPRPDRVRRAEAEKCPAFQPAVPSVGTRSTSC
jgi:hypothetical protein